MPAPFEAAPHTPKATGRTGVILMALGTPDALTKKALRRYLAEFLSDPRVVEMPRPLWLPILYGPILMFRPKRALKAYGKIWNYDLDESPLRTYTRKQAEGLQGRMGEDVMVDWAFRYGKPDLKTVLARMQDAGVDRIVFMPLYPQYSATTVASANDLLFDILKTMRWQPAVRTMAAFHDAPPYIDALAESVQNELKGLDWQPERLLASYHSIPHAYWENGDPYPCQCFKTTRLLGEALGVGSDHLISCFQSRVGRSRWVGPYAEETVIRLAQEGVRKLAVLAPAFIADCVETLEEINVELRATFLKHGGTHFHYIPCLNADRRGLDVLEWVARREAAGWV